MPNALRYLLAAGRWLCFGAGLLFGRRKYPTAQRAYRTQQSEVGVNAAVVRFSFHI